MPIEIHPELSEAEEDQVKTWLGDFNQAENGAFFDAIESGGQAEFALVAKDEGGRVAGGLLGSTVLRWLKIDILSVCPEQRRRGIGRQLMEEAEIRARETGCDRVYVDTMSYQAPEFYTSLGYTEVCRLEDWDSQGHDKLFYTKRLPPLEETAASE